eukprot:scaffold233202_cov21-Prasinocladus_malaysianus.AAC.1
MHVGSRLLGRRCSSCVMSAGVKLLLRWRRRVGRQQRGQADSHHRRDGERHRGQLPGARLSLGGRHLSAGLSSAPVAARAPQTPRPLLICCSSRNIH